MEFVITADGSKTLYHAAVGEHYHSINGALQESKHVFQQAGLAYFLAEREEKRCAILEVGFGTGLNFLMSAAYAKAQDIKLDYCGIEAYPLPEDVILGTGYADYVVPEIWDNFSKAYTPALEGPVAFNDAIQLQIANQKVMDFQADKKFDVIYFDAFAAVHQPEMWTAETIAHVCQFLAVGGVFVTYAITGNLKRTMKGLGFAIEKAPGAPGKREMLRATKLA